MLVQGVAKDLTRRGVKAIEAFGDLQSEGLSCVLPADYLLAVGFKTVRPHLHYPRLRLELKTARVLARGRGGGPGTPARLGQPGTRPAPRLSGAALPAGLRRSSCSIRSE